MPAETRAAEFLRFAAETAPCAAVALMQGSLQARGLYALGIDGDPGSIERGQTWAGFRAYLGGDAAGEGGQDDPSLARLARPASPRYREIQRQSPNWRGSNRRQGCVLHHTSGSYEGSVDWCLRAESEVSYHCIIAKDGKRTQLCEDEQRAWHAGVSKWRGESNCNGFMLGLAFAGDTYVAALTDDQIASGIEWLLPRIEKYGWVPRLQIPDHRMVSPGRKKDLKESEYLRFLAALEKVMGIA